MTWNPTQYQQYADVRLRPALELLARIALPEPRTVVDLGCGAGNVTRLLAERWPGAAIAGVDSSEEMLAKARAAKADLSQVSFHSADIGKVDVRLFDVETGGVVVCVLIGDEVFQTSVGSDGRLVPFAGRNNGFFIQAQALV